MRRRIATIQASCKLETQLLVELQNQKPIQMCLLPKLDYSWWHLRVDLGCSCRESEFAGTAGSDEHLFNTRLRHLAAAATISAAVTVGGSEASTDVRGTSFNGVF